MTLRNNRWCPVGSDITRVITHQVSHFLMVLVLMSSEGHKTSHNFFEQFLRLNTSVYSVLLEALGKHREVVDVSSRLCIPWQSKFGWRPIWMNTSHKTRDHLVLLEENLSRCSRKQHNWISQHEWIPDSGQYLSILINAKRSCDYRLSIFRSVFPFY